jgi:energy-coupling factor transport system permease protein
LAFEYYPGNDIFHRLDPRVKLLWWVMIIFLSLAFPDVTMILIIIISILLLMKYARLPYSGILRIVKSTAIVIFGYGAYTTLSLFATSTPGTAQASHVLFSYQIPYLMSTPSFLTLEALFQGMRASLLVVVIILQWRVLVMMTPLRDLILGFVRLKVPPEFGIAAGLAFAYIPVLVDENDRIREALESRGWTDYSSKNLVKRGRGLLGRMIVPSILSGFRRAQLLAVALESRGFGYNIAGRTYVHQIKLQRNDKIAVAIFAAFIVFAAIFGQYGLGILGWNATANLLRLLGLIP